MLIGTRLRQLREQKQLSQGDIEERTGLLRCYVSRVENGHTVPSLETLERFAGVLDVPLYQLFFSRGRGSADSEPYAAEDTGRIDRGQRRQGNRRSVPAETPEPLGSAC